ncbi:MAG: ribonuclease P protein component [Selenomonadaceae bacterium]|nr:ribonuclease P protein component [Selenomonadaceae bacterium]
MDLQRKKHPCGLPRKRMLKRRSDFQRVYHAGRSCANRYMVLYVFEVQEGFGKMRGKAAFAAGKKLGCAVKRNRVKRLLREVYRHHQDGLRDDIAVLLVGRKAMVEASTDEVSRTFVGLAKRAKAWRKEADRR